MVFYLIFPLSSEIHKKYIVKPYLEQISSTHESSFLCRHFSLHHFDSKFHFHPEYELTFIEKSCGKRFVGQHMGSFEPGDLVLIGKQVPHCWLNDVPVGETHEASSIVIQFRENFLGENWHSNPEFSSISKMLRLSERGISFNVEVSLRAARNIHELLNLNPFERMIKFLELLQLLSLEDNNTLLNDHQCIRLSEDDCNRIQVVIEYIQSNFTEQIRLKEVAEMMFMTQTSFCRYFKKITRKTFSRFLIEFRMEYVRNQLINSDKSITDICYKSGFCNLAHFNEQFKLLNKITPRGYRNQFTDDCIYS
jgi:AraC-like DNA-binding protein